MQLSTNHIIVSDLDTPRKDLLVWLVSPPKYGFIENTQRGEIFLCMCDRWLSLGHFLLHEAPAGSHIRTQTDKTDVHVCVTQCRFLCVCTRSHLHYSE